MDWTIILVILLVFFITSTVAAVVALVRAVDRISYFEKWTEEFLQRIYNAYVELKAIDKSGHFEADDEVGYFFKSLTEIMERLFEMGIIDEDEVQKQIEDVYEKRNTEKNVSELNETIKRSKREPGTKKVAEIGK